MARRILAAVVAVLAVVVLTPDRLGGEPATTRVAPPTAPPTASTTTTTFGIGSIPDDTPERPLSLYPRRPGAKYEDAEARPHTTVVLNGNRLRVTWTVGPHAALPSGSAPAALGPYRTLGFVDGYAPSATHAAGDILHVVVHARPALFAPTLTCVATVASDGTVLVPYAVPPARGSRPSTTTTPFDISTRRFALDLYLPLGARRGRIYLSCVDTEPSLANLGQPDQTRAVWGFDV